MRQLMSTSKVTISAMECWPFLLTAELSRVQVDIHTQSATLCSEMVATLIRQRAKLVSIGPTRPYLRMGIALQMAIVDDEVFVQIDPHPAHGDFITTLWPAVVQAFKATS